MSLNLIQTILRCTVAPYGIVGLLVKAFEDHVPRFIAQIYSCEIIDDTIGPAPFSWKVPKRWYRHFYDFGATFSSVLLALTVFKYIYNVEVPNLVYWILDLLLGTRRQVLVSSESTILAMILLTTHLWRRLYETHYISVYSNAKIHVSHYILGYLHYIGTACSIIGESEGFVRGSRAMLHWDRLTTLQHAAAIIFLYACFEQLRTNIILANLRRNKKGKVVTTSYRIPHGGLFEYTSSPLQFTEIIIYIMISIILWESSTYHYMCTWVLVNQAIYAIHIHSWYLKNFTDYPKERKILVPYVL